MTPRPTQGRGTGCRASQAHSRWEEGGSPHPEPGKAEPQIPPGCEGHTQPLCCPHLLQEFPPGPALPCSSAKGDAGRQTQMALRGREEAGGQACRHGCLENSHAQWGRTSSASPPLLGAQQSHWAPGRQAGRQASSGPGGPWRERQPLSGGTCTQTLEGGKLPPLPSAFSTRLIAEVSCSVLLSSSAGEEFWTQIWTERLGAQDFEGLSHPNPRVSLRGERSPRLEWEVLQSSRGSEDLPPCPQEQK